VNYTRAVWTVTAGRRTILRPSAVSYQHSAINPTCVFFTPSPSASLRIDSERGFILNLQTVVCVTGHLSRPDTSQSKRKILHLPTVDSG